MKMTNLVKRFGKVLCSITTATIMSLLLLMTWVHGLAQTEDTSPREATQTQQSSQSVKLGNSSTHYLLPGGGQGESKGSPLETDNCKVVKIDKPEIVHFGQRFTMDFYGSVECQWSKHTTVNVGHGVRDVTTEFISPQHVRVHATAVREPQATQEDKK